MVLGPASEVGDLAAQQGLCFPQVALAQVEGPEVSAEVLDEVRAETESRRVLVDSRSVGGQDGSAGAGAQLERGLQPPLGVPGQAIEGVEGRRVLITPGLG